MSKKVNNLEKNNSVTTVTETNNIQSFITAISTKKYALAHKYLKQVIEDKISKRIASSLNQPLF